MPPGVDDAQDCGGPGKPKFVVRFGGQKLKQTTDSGSFSASEVLQAGKSTFWGLRGGAKKVLAFFFSKLPLHVFVLSHRLKQRLDEGTLRTR
jgi:hypothetical protein